MKLFSWFMKRNDITSDEVVSPALKAAANPSADNMWPTAKVRRQTNQTQQNYINTLLNLNTSKRLSLKAKENRPA